MYEELVNKGRAARCLKEVLVKSFIGKSSFIKREGLTLNPISFSKCKEMLLGKSFVGRNKIIEQNNDGASTKKPTNSSILNRA